MKKITVILLSIIILCSFSVLVQAENKEYEAKAYTDHKVYYYDAEKEPEYCYLYLHLSTPEIEKYESVVYNININNNVVKYDTYITVHEGSFNRTIEHTDTGYVYTVSLIGGSDSDGITIVFSVAGIGDLNFDVTATGYYPDGTQKPLTIDLEKPYDKVVDISEVEFLDKEKYEYIYQHALADLGTTAGELVSASGAKTAAVINADGEILDADKPVSTGAFLATMYEGFVVDSIEFVVKYDVNGDGIVTAADARLALRISSRLEVSIWDAYKKAADINNSGGVTAADARLILRKAAKLDVSDIPGKEEPSTEINKFTVSAVLKSEYVNKQEECKEYFEDCEYIKGIIVFSTTDCEVGLEFSLTGTGAENYDATVEFIENSGFFSAVYYHEV